MFWFEVVCWTIGGIVLVAHVAFGLVVGREMKRRGLNKFGLPMRKRD